MRFFEHEAKRLLGRRGVPLPEGRLARTADEAAEAQRQLGGAVVLKSQVLSGGRMKAGGVRFAESAAEARAAAEAILALPINDQRPQGVLVERKGEIAQEYYAAVTWDGRAKRPVIVFSDMGGIDIEEVAETHPEHVSRTHLSALRPSPTTRRSSPSRAPASRGAISTGSPASCSSSRAPSASTI